eukprot:g25684.t1
MARSPRSRQERSVERIDMSRIDGEELSPEELPQVAHKCGANAWRLTPPPPGCAFLATPGGVDVAPTAAARGRMRGSEFGEVLSVPCEPERCCQMRWSGCAVQAREWAPVETSKEKYVFLVRHAQSTWNREVEPKLRAGRRGLEESKEGTWSWALWTAAHIATREVWHRDHPISDEGVLQSQRLREKIRQARCQGHDHFHSESEEDMPRRPEEETRIRRFYDRFLESTQSIYCSPLLRALQTAHFALSDQDGSNLVDRAVTMSKSLLSEAETDQLETRVDASDCEEKWWSDDPETEADVDRRLQELWRRLLDDDAEDSCILVTHSNLIKALLMRFGGVTGPQQSAPHRDVASPSTVASEEEDGYHCLTSEGGASWQVVDSGPQDLQRLKVERLQNCGVLGLRCVLEANRSCVAELGILRSFGQSTQIDSFGQAPLEDGLEDWLDLSTPEKNASRWVAKDALLMFDSVSGSRAEEPEVEEDPDMEDFAFFAGLTETTGEPEACELEVPPTASSSSRASAPLAFANAAKEKRQEEEELRQEEERKRQEEEERREEKRRKIEEERRRKEEEEAREREKKRREEAIRQAEEERERRAQRRKMEEEEKKRTEASRIETVKKRAEEIERRRQAEEEFLANAEAQKKAQAKMEVKVPSSLPVAEGSLSALLRTGAPDLRRPAEPAEPPRAPVLERHSRSPRRSERRLDRVDAKGWGFELVETDR